MLTIDGVGHADEVHERIHKAVLTCLDS
jgi:hypothetical protein